MGKHETGKIKYIPIKLVKDNIKDDRIKNIEKLCYEQVDIILGSTQYKYKYEHFLQTAKQLEDYLMSNDFNASLYSRYFNLVMKQHNGDKIDEFEMKLMCNYEHRMLHNELNKNIDMAKIFEVFKEFKLMRYEVKCVVMSDILFTRLNQGYKYLMVKYKNRFMKENITVLTSIPKVKNIINNSVVYNNIQKTKLNENIIILDPSVQMSVVESELKNLNITTVSYVDIKDSRGTIYDLNLDIIDIFNTKLSSKLNICKTMGSPIFTKLTDGHDRPYKVFKNNKLLTSLRF